MGAGGGARMGGCRVMRGSSYALAVLFAIVPLYGTLVVLDPATPPIPPLIPVRGAVAIALLAVPALAAVVPAALRAARRDALTFAFPAPGVATILAAVTGFDPLTGIGFGILVTAQGAGGLALARDADAATVRLCVRTFLWSALAASLLALAMVVAHRPVAIYAYDNGRAVGTFLNPNELAAYTLIGLGLPPPLTGAS